MRKVSNDHPLYKLINAHEIAGEHRCLLLVWCIILFLFCFSTTVVAEVLDFDGIYSGSRGNWSIDVPFTLSNHSIVDITYDPQCLPTSSSALYLRTGDLTDITDEQATLYYYNIATSLDGEPLKGYPLHAGAYIARITCRLAVDDDNPGWSLNVSAEPIDLTFASADEEPASMEATAITRSTSFSGWLGLWGKADDPVFTQDNLTGQDVSDYKFYSLSKGTKIKFRATWRSFTASTDVEKKPAMNVRIEFYRDGKTYFVDNFDLLENSGDVTKEISLLEDGVYKVTAIDVSYGDAKEYRAYKVDVIVNGTTELAAEINSINSITTAYWDERKWVETGMLILGQKSEVGVSISNPSPQDINATLVYGLSVRGLNPVIVGRANLTLPANSSALIYKTFLETPADTPISLKGDLLALLYDDTGTLLDSFETVVDIWGPNHGAVVLPAVVLLLGTN